MLSASCAVLEQAHAVERIAQVADFSRGALAGAALRAHRVQRGDDFRIPLGIVAERVPQGAAVGDQFG